MDRESLEIPIVIPTVTLEIEQPSTWLNRTPQQSNHGRISQPDRPRNWTPPMDIHRITRSVQSMLDPKVDNVERSECFKIVENYKANMFQFTDLPLLCSPGQNPAVILFGLQCLEYRIKHSWDDISLDCKQEIKTCLFKMITDLNDLLSGTEENKVVPIILAQIFVHLIKCEWPQNWPSMVEDFLRLGSEGLLQARLVLSIFLRLYEDLLQFQNVPQSRRRDIISSLNEKLVTIFSFALDLIKNQLDIWENTFPSFQMVALCKDSLLMLSGFLDTCRTDVLTQWKPRGGPPGSAADGTAFVQVLTRLIGHECIRIDSLSLLAILLKRKSQLSSGHPEDSFSLLDIILRNDDILNQLSSTVCSLVEEPPVYTESRYNCLVLFAEVMQLLGGGLITNWSEMQAYANPCTCDSQRKLLCPNRATHLLDSMTRLTTYPIRMICVPLFGFWSAALRSPESPLATRLRPLCSTLFMTWRNNAMKDGGPSGTGVHSEWSRAIFEPDDWGVFFARFRLDLFRAVSSAASCWPEEFTRLLSSWIEARTATPVTISDMDNAGVFTSPTSPASLDWDSLALFLEHILSTLNTACQREDCHAQFELALVSWARLFVQVLSNITDPNIRGKVLVCTSLVLQQLDTKYDAEFLVLLLNNIFSSFRYTAPSELNGNPFNRPKCVKAMQLLAATAFFRLVKAIPERVMPHFQAIANEVANLWTDSVSGVVEKSVLLESLISLCFRLPQSLDVQKDLLKQLLSGVLGQWSQNAANIPGPMGPLLTSCASGGLGLFTALGLDQPIENLSSFDSPPVQTRITLTRNILTLMAAVRRLAGAVRLDQLENITVPLLEPVTSSVLLVLRAFNELWEPEILNRVHPSMRPAFEISNHLKVCLLSSQSQRASRDDEKTPLDRWRSCVYDCHENLFHIVGSLFLGLRTRLYALPTDQLALILHQGCCAAFEHLPDLRLNMLIRTVIRPFIRYCPKEHMETALVPLLPPIVEAVVTRLDARWSRLSAISQIERLSQDAVAEELFSERLTRILSRTFMDLMGCIYAFNGFTSSETMATNLEAEPGEADIGEDVCMMGDETKCAATPVTTRTVGALAHLLANYRPCFEQNGATTDGTTWIDNLFLTSLLKCLTWHDGPTCLKASQWICPLIDLLTQQTHGESTAEKNRIRTPLPPPLAEGIMFGVLCGLHGDSSSSMPTLLAVGLRVYNAVENTVVQTNLRNLVTQALVAAEQPANAKQLDRISHSIQMFEEKILQSKAKPMTDKAKREALRKLLLPLIGIPISERFQDRIIVSCLPPIARSSWRKPRKSSSAISGDLGLADLFS